MRRRAIRFYERRGDVLTVETSQAPTRWETAMKILYATDGSEPAYAAGDAIETLVDPERNEITVLSVTQIGMPAVDGMPYILDDLRDRRENALATVDQTAARLQAAGFKVRGHTAEGHPGREIVRLVEDEWFDVTVVGGSSKRWLANRLLGSVSTHVLHHSPSSVLIVHEAPKAEGACVLIGVDGSQHADRAVNELCGFLMPGLTVKAYSVAPPPSAIAVPFVPMPSVRTSKLDEARERAIEHAWSVAESAARSLREAGYKGEADATSGHPAHELLTEAERGAYDLVAVGSRGLTALRRTLTGSVSDNIARHANAALVVRRSFE